MKNVLALEKIDPNNFPELQGWKEKQQTVLKENPLVEVTDHESYGVAKKHRTALKTARTTLEKQDKLIATKLRELRTKTGDVISDLVKITKGAEDKQQIAIATYELERERIKEEKAELERVRIQGIKDGIDNANREIFEFINTLTFKDVDGGKLTFEQILSDHKKETDFAEFESMYETLVEERRIDFGTKVSWLNQEENQRLENERLKKVAEDARKEAEKLEKRIEAERVIRELADEKARKERLKKEAEEAKKREEIEAKLAEMQKRNDALEEEKRLAKEKEDKAIIDSIEVVDPETVDVTVTKVNEDDVIGFPFEDDKLTLIEIVENVHQSFNFNMKPSLKTKEATAFVKEIDLSLHQWHLTMVEKIKTL